MHFMECLRRNDPATIHMLHDELQKIEADMAARHDVYRRLYSPSLSKLISVTGFDRGQVKASGHFVTVCGGDRADAGGAANGKWPYRRIFDGVAGVACSLRGHNPSNFPDEIRETLDRDGDLFDEVSRHLQTLTGLAHHVPAVSGAAAVEQALQIALSIEPDRPHVLALEGGFGGKTLAALTGTSKTRYKQNLGPLYQHVTYVDPFAPTAVDDIRKALGSGGIDSGRWRSATDSSTDSGHDPAGTRFAEVSVVRRRSADRNVSHRTVCSIAGCRNLAGHPDHRQGHIRHHLSLCRDVVQRRRSQQAGSAES